jgi:DNA-binding NtrC family response regulator
MSSWSSSFVHSPLRLLTIDVPECTDVLEVLADEIGVEAVCCPTLDDAFEQLARFKPHIVVVNPRVSELGEIGMLRAMHVLAPHCDVVLAVPEWDSEVEVEAVKAGALACLTMPIDWLRVRDILLNAAKRHQRVERTDLHVPLYEWTVAADAQDDGSFWSPPGYLTRCA